MDKCLGQSRTCPICKLDILDERACAGLLNTEAEPVIGEHRRAHREEAGEERCYCSIVWVAGKRTGRYSVEVTKGSWPPSADPRNQSTGAYTCILQDRHASTAISEASASANQRGPTPWSRPLAGTMRPEGPLSS
eukprot:4338446-Heterocapsa_arctica.AAC.1